MPCEILLVDDDPLSLKSLESILNSKYSTLPFTSPLGAERYLATLNVPLVLLDLHLPGLSGLQILKQWREKYPQTEIIFCSGEKRVEVAIECIREGASDFITKPFEAKDVLLFVDRVLEKSRLKKQAEELQSLLHPTPIEFIGNSKKIKELLEKINLLKNQTHLNVLILGESGTGKEIVARLLHQQEKSNRPFVVANMPAIPATLMEAELFGSEKGAYTDSKTSRAGKFELADEGDIFLDEIGDLPFETQSKILRTLQEKQIERVGSQKIRHINFRVISATNQPLSTLISIGKFREDLLYRLSDLVLWIPPLRERKEDIPLLVNYFIQKYSNAKTTQISDAAIQQLIDYHWPGNVRELESTIKRALVLNRKEQINSIEIYDPMKFTPENETISGLEDQLKAYEKRLFSEAKIKHGENRQAMMDDLKISKATFYRKLSELNLN